MSIRIVILVSSCLIAACNQENSKPGSTATRELARNNDTIDKQSVEVPFDNLGDFGDLVPIEIVKPKSTNVYEKFGIEFSGSCYTCDLAAISINKKTFDIINVCDKEDFYRLGDWTYSPSPNGIVVVTKENKFIFTKVDDAPVYELKVTGEKLVLKGKRISKFYTQREELKKFKQHDCGEFDG